MKKTGELGDLHQESCLAGAWGELKSLGRKVSSSSRLYNCSGMLGRCKRPSEDMAQPRFSASNGPKARPPKVGHSMSRLNRDARVALLAPGCPAEVSSDQGAMLWSAPAPLLKLSWREGEKSDSLTVLQ